MFCLVMNVVQMASNMMAQIVILVIILLVLTVLFMMGSSILQRIVLCIQTIIVAHQELHLMA